MDMFEIRLNARKSAREQEQELIDNGHNLATIDIE